MHPAEHRRLLDFEPVLRELAARHWAPPPVAAPSPLTTQLDSALKFFGRDLLTEREAVSALLSRTMDIARQVRSAP